MEWKKTGKAVTKDGTTITYESGEYTIESRKRHIPHASTSGTWDLTTFFVLKDGQELAENRSLKEAKNFAEKHAEA